ncbi:MAG: hypothetical protein ACFCU6_01095, partial [Balneolaceae bacterium]
PKVMPKYLVDANLPYYFSIWKDGEYLVTSRRNEKQRNGVIVSFFSVGQHFLFNKWQRSAGGRKFC